MASSYVKSSLTRSLQASAACLLLSISAANADEPAVRALATAAVADLGAGPVYWHLDTFLTLNAARAANSERGNVAEAFGKVWLFTLGPASWRPAGGEHVATIVPLPVRANGRYTASYMQAATKPGFRTDIHQHGGPEALFTLSGEVCVEIPSGALIGRAGEAPLLIAGDTPMQLSSVGTEERRSLVLILHDESQPWKVPAEGGWKPLDLCKKLKG